MSFEKRLEYQNSLKSTISLNTTSPASVNILTSKGNYSSGQRHQNQFNNRHQYENNQRGGGGQGRSRGRWNANTNNRTICQVCGKIRHTALVYHRFEKQFT